MSVDRQVFCTRAKALYICASEHGPKGPFFHHFPTIFPPLFHHFSVYSNSDLLYLLRQQDHANTDQQSRYPAAAVDVFFEKDFSEGRAGNEGERRRSRGHQAG